MFRVADVETGKFLLSSHQPSYTAAPVDQETQSTPLFNSRLALAAIAVATISCVFVGAVTSGAAGQAFQHSSTIGNQVKSTVYAAPRLARLDTALHQFPQTVEELAPVTTVPKAEELTTGYVHLGSKRLDEESYLFEYGTRLELEVRHARSAVEKSSSQLLELQQQMAQLEGQVKQAVAAAIGPAAVFLEAKTKGEELKAAMEQAEAQAKEAKAAAHILAAEVTEAQHTTEQRRAEVVAVEKALHNAEATKGNAANALEASTAAVQAAEAQSEAAKKELQSAESKLVDSPAIRQLQETQQALIEVVQKAGPLEDVLKAATMRRADADADYAKALGKTQKAEKDVLAIEQKMQAAKDLSNDGAEAVKSAAATAVKAQEKAMSKAQKALSKLLPGDDGDITLMKLDQAIVTAKANLEAAKAQASPTTVAKPTKKAGQEKISHVAQLAAIRGKLDGTDSTGTIPTTAPATAEVKTALQQLEVVQVARAAVIAAQKAAEAEKNFLAGAATEVIARELEAANMALLPLQKALEDARQSQSQAAAEEEKAKSELATVKVHEAELKKTIQTLESKVGVERNTMEMLLKVVENAKAQVATAEKVQTKAIDEQSKAVDALKKAQQEVDSASSQLAKAVAEVQAAEKAAEAKAQQAAQAMEASAAAEQAAKAAMAALESQNAVIAEREVKAKETEAVAANLKEEVQRMAEELAKSKAKTQKLKNQLTKLESQLSTAAAGQ